MKYKFSNRFIFDLFTFIFLSVCSVHGYMVEDFSQYLPSIFSDVFKNFIRIFYKPSIIFTKVLKMSSKYLFFTICQNFLKISKMKKLPIFPEVLLYFRKIFSKISEDFLKLRVLT